MAPAKKQPSNTEAIKPTKLPPAFEPVNQFFEKKLRNLEKRKGKLDGYRALQKEGKELEPGQLQAVEKYDEVVISMSVIAGLVQELIPVFCEVSLTSEKATNLKEKESVVKTKTVIRSMLDIQDLYEQLGDETVRSDFLTGSSKAVKLSEEQISDIDKLYEVSKPTRSADTGCFLSPTEYEHSLSGGVDVWNKLINKSSANVPGTETKYEELMNLFSAISTCEYFDVREPEESSVTTTNAASEPVETLTHNDVGNEHVSTVNSVKTDRTASDVFGSITQDKVVNFVQDDYENRQLVDPAVISAHPMKQVSNNFEGSNLYDDNYSQDRHAVGNFPIQHSDGGTQFGHFNGKAHKYTPNDAKVLNNDTNSQKFNLDDSFPIQTNWADEHPEGFDMQMNSSNADSFVEVRRGGNPKFGGRSDFGRDNRGDFGSKRNNNRGDFRPRPYRGDFRGGFRGSRPFGQDFRGGGQGRGGRPQRGGFEQRVSNQ